MEPFLPLFFYTLMFWFYRMAEGKDLLGKPRPNVDDQWRATTGRTMRRAVIIIVAAYSALLLVQLR
ncbi:hypothetical protein E5K00_22605 [Hymenobacter aquaticus]|uniref:Uncharacterized protein n=1 Tax=Hymenobacter aquaticus TaxID=1867101 RepID=A0A4Z0PU39_9BACT|nr:hypothetical protein [Hymenobacter aquaticus]TGE20774.1 hypothetical protein E5K00_22605 [Hymenobacter aquaticus]